MDRMRSRLWRRALNMLLVFGLVACGPSPSGGPTGSPGIDIESLPQPGEVTLAGLLNAELEVRAGLRESSGIGSLLEDASAGFWERFDADLAEHGWVALNDLADEAGLGPVASSGLTVGLGVIGSSGVRPVWEGSLQAVSGNFSLSMFMGMVVREWQRMADSDWRATGELPPSEHDKVANGVAEHSSIRTTVNGSASADQLRFEITVVSEATLTSVASSEVIATYNANGRGLIEVKGCPDPDGVAEGHYTLELEERGTGVGGAAAGGSTVIDGPFRIFNGDDAHLIKTDFEGRFDSAANGTGPSGEPFDWSVQSTIPISITPGGGVTGDAASATWQENNGGEKGHRATVSIMMLAAQFLGGVAKEAEQYWRSGKCVDLTPSEESRKVKPSEELSLDVTATHHFDHQEIQAPISAEFSGKDSIDPGSGTLVDPPASFTFTAGSESGDKGTIKLEQKSRRGIGKKTLEFEVEPQDLLVSLNGTYQLGSGGQFQINVHFVITNLRLTRGDDDVYRGSGSGTVVGGSVLSGNCTATVDSPVAVRAEGRVNASDGGLIRITFPLESISGGGTEICPTMSVAVPAAAAVGPILASAGRGEIRIGESVTTQLPVPGGSVSSTVTVVRASGK
jgi:hypothetical protein